MEAINYANGSNMTLPADAQIVQGISGNAVYLPAGKGTAIETNLLFLFGGSGTES